MKESRFGTLGGLDAPILVYETVAEADQVVKDGILKHGNASLAYRGPLADVRDLVCDILEEAGYARKRYDKAGAETTVEKDVEDEEKPQAFAKRICGAQGWLKDDGSPDLTRFQTQLDTLCRSLPASFKNDAGKPLAVDLTERVREPRGPRKIPDATLAKVTQIYDGDKRDRFIGAIASKLGVQLAVTTDREADLKKFALAAMDYDRKIRQEAAEKAKGELFGETIMATFKATIEFLIDSDNYDEEDTPLQTEKDATELVQAMLGGDADFPDDPTIKVSAI